MSAREDQLTKLICAHLHFYYTAKALDSDGVVVDKAFYGTAVKQP